MIDIIYVPRDRQAASDVSREIYGFWTELAKDERCRDEVRAAGLDPSELQKIGPEGITIKMQGAGLEPTAILLAFGSKVLYDLWKQVLLPWVKQKLGDDILTEHRSAKRSGRRPSKS